MISMVLSAQAPVCASAREGATRLHVHAFNQQSSLRVVSEVSKVRMGGVDSTVGTVTTSYTGETAYERSAGGAVLEAQGEDGISGGQRTAVRTDAQGITTTTVSDEASGELMAETKAGVAAAGGHAAQPEVTTAYALRPPPGLDR